MRSLLITSCGGPATANVIANLRLANFQYIIVGVDVNPWLSKLSKADFIHLIHKATDVSNYIIDLNSLTRQYDITLLYPQSDAEVFTCSKYRLSLASPVCLPEHRVIEICQDKGKLYDYLQKAGIQVPPYRLPTKHDLRMLCLTESPNYGAGYGWQDWYPCWVRARQGAGGNKGFVCRDWRDFKNMVEFNYGRGEEIDWMMVKLLNGRDFSWTSIWKDGKLLTSVLKERLQWVYNRIGTTAVQRTIHDYPINKYCRDIVRALDDRLTGIMMIDLKEDSDKSVYVTEVNAGRLGTVNYFYGYASMKIYNDHRVNFPLILWKLHHDEPLTYMKEFDALPKDIYWVRHLDMGYGLFRGVERIG